MLVAAETREGRMAEGVGGNCDGDLLRLAACDVVDIQLAAGFIDDLVFVISAGPANIPLGAVGKLVGLFRFYVVCIEIESVVLVRTSRKFFLRPSGVAMRARSSGDFLRRVATSNRKYKDLLGPAARIPLPGAKITEERGVDGLQMRRERNLRRRKRASGGPAGGRLSGETV